MMVRTVWLGLAFLIATCGLVTFKISIATLAKQQIASADETTMTADRDAAPTIKADRFDVNYLDDVPAKTSVHTISIVIPQPAPKARPEKIISRHWHAGYARVTKRSIQRQREASRSRTEVEDVNRRSNLALTQFWCSPIILRQLVWLKADRFSRGRTFDV
jgi:hypothetical protein